MSFRRSLFIVACFLIPAAFSQTAECKLNFLCTDDFCSSECGPKDCFIPDGKECEGVLLPLYDNKKDFCSCCNLRCVTYLKEGDPCTNKPTTPFPTQVCGPQLSCQKLETETSHRCLPGTTRCLLELKAYNDALEDGSLGMNVNAPVCDEDGYYSPLQCYRGGLCRCVDKVKGEPIFGITGGETESMESMQDCKCAVNYHEAIEQGCRMTVPFFGVNHTEEYKTAYDDCLASPNYFKSHMRCLTNGNFDPIQCVTSHIEDRCFCVDNDLNVNGTITYQSVTTDLKCYNSTIHYPAYFRPCEAISAARRFAAEKDHPDRTYYDGATDPVCSPDGFFHPVQKRKNNATNVDELFCSDRMGEPLDAYAAETASDAGLEMDCECAFARKYLSDGVPKPTCCPNGNYRTYQCQAGQCYCVDRFGKQTEKEVDQLEIGDLHCVEECKSVVA